MKAKRLFLVLLSWIIILGIPASSLAQSSETLTLDLSRDFGYSSGTGKIQGTFSMKVKGPDDLNKVVFFIDDESVGEATSAPFKLQFDTSSFPLGIHTLVAKGYTNAGEELVSNEKKVEFVSSQEGIGSAMGIIFPLLGVILLAVVISYVLPLLLGKGKQKDLPPGAPRSYAPLGGTICPKCQRPFAIHIYGLNILVGKYDRCPYCGRWSIVNRYSMTALKNAEAAEIEDSNQLPGTPDTPLDEAERLRKELENSRFQDL